MAKKITIDSTQDCILFEELGSDVPNLFPLSDVVWYWEQTDTTEPAYSFGMRNKNDGKPIYGFSATVGGTGLPQVEVDGTLYTVDTYNWDSIVYSMLGLTGEITHALTGVAEPVLYNVEFKGATGVFANAAAMEAAFGMTEGSVTAFYNLETSFLVFATEAFQIESGAITDATIKRINDNATLIRGFGDFCFQGNTSLAQVNATPTLISEAAFKNCSSLAVLDVSAVETFLGQAVSGTAIETLIFSNSLVTLADDAFDGWAASGKSITIPVAFEYSAAVVAATLAGADITLI